MEATEAIAIDRITQITFLDRTAQLRNQNTLVLAVDSFRTEMFGEFFCVNRVGFQW